MSKLLLCIFSVEQIQLDFVEMLRVRDEKRRIRHVEMLRQQKEEEEEAEKAGRGGGGAARVELLGDLDDQESVFSSATSKPHQPLKTASHSPTISSPSISTDIQNRKVRWSHLMLYSRLKEVFGQKGCHLTFRAT